MTSLVNCHLDPKFGEAAACPSTICRYIERTAKNPYTLYPPKMFHWMQNENSDVGPIALASETVI